MSRSHGTGQLVFMRCAMCRRTQRHQGHVTPTGKRRYRPNHNGGRVDVLWQYEYRCLDCEHIGWSRHITLAQRFDEQFPDKLIE